MQKIIQNLGLRETDPIVVYDDGSFFDAARLFWALEVYGFTNVKLLNSGYAQWVQKALHIFTRSAKPTKSTYIVIVNNKRLATKFTTQIATRNPNQLIIDTRDNKSYRREVYKELDKKKKIVIYCAGINYPYNA